LADQTAQPRRPTTPGGKASTTERRVRCRPATSTAGACPEKQKATGRAPSECPGPRRPRAEFPRWKRAASRAGWERSGGEAAGCPETASTASARCAARTTRRAGGPSPARGRAGGRIPQKSCGVGRPRDDGLGSGFRGPPAGGKCSPGRLGRALFRCDATPWRSRVGRGGGGSFAQQRFSSVCCRADRRNHDYLVESRPGGLFPGRGLTFQRSKLPAKPTLRG